MYIVGPGVAKLDTTEKKKLVLVEAERRRKQRMNGRMDDVYVRWETPRRFTVRLYDPGKRPLTGVHHTLGVVAETVEQAARAAQTRYPNGCIQSINDTGPVDIVACALRGEGE